MKTPATGHAARKLGQRTRPAATRTSYKPPKVDYIQQLKYTMHYIFIFFSALDVDNITLHDKTFKLLVLLCVLVSLIRKFLIQMNDEVMILLPYSIEHHVERISYTNYTCKRIS